MSAAFILWHKHMSKLRANPEETIGMLLQPVLWVVLFGAGMKGMMGGMPGADNNYIAFMVPGIVAFTALSGGIGGGTVWLNERLRGIVKATKSSAAPPTEAVKVNSPSSGRRRNTRVV